MAPETSSVHTSVGDSYPSHTQPLQLVIGTTTWSIWVPAMSRKVNVTSHPVPLSAWVLNQPPNRRIGVTKLNVAAPLADPTNWEPAYGFTVHQLVQPLLASMLFEQT